MTPTQLDPETTAKCVELTRALGLLVAGIDLRHTPDGQWCCFEANTSPAFTWFEDYTKQPITTAIANLLAAGSSARR